jgi:hypothetical protein
MKKPLAAIAKLVILLSISACTKAPEGGEQRNEAAPPSFGLCGENLRVTNGIACEKLNETALVLLQIEINGQPQAICSGALISDRTILTAAHCLDRSTGVTGLVAGFPKPITEEADPKFEARAIESFITHPSWDSRPGNPYDIGIVTLEKSMFDRAPAVLISPGYAPVESGDQISIYGFGKNETGAVGTLRRGIMILEKFPTGLQYPDDLLGAAFNRTKQSICSGDSGGPAAHLTAHGIGIVAVNSVGTSERCLDDDMAGFANIQVDKNFDFILKQKKGTVSVITSQGVQYR